MQKPQKIMIRQKEGAIALWALLITHSRDFHGAIENHKEHLNISKVAGNREGEGRAYSNLGIAYRCLCNCQRAIVYQKQHISIAKVVGDGAEEGGARGNLGHVYQCRVGDIQRAGDYYKQHLSISKEICDTGRRKMYLWQSRQCL